MRTRTTFALVVTGVAAAVAAASATEATAQRIPRCTAQHLVGAIIDVQGAAGSRFGRLLLTNRSRRNCRTLGFIGGQLIAPNGDRLPTEIVRDTHVRPRRVLIRSGAAAVVSVRWNVIPSGNRPCRRARWLRVTPPDGTKATRVYFGDTPCRGRITVGPVRPAAIQ